MKWLVVLGTTTWIPFKGAKYGPGKHQIDEKTEAAARKMIERGHKNLLLLDEEPTIVFPSTTGPLSKEDIKLGTKGVKLHTDDVEVPDEEDPFGLPMEYECDWCPARFPSAPARNRHMEMNHGVPVN